MSCCYNLSEIPNFTDLFTENNEFNNIFYNVKKYSTKSNQEYKIISYNKNNLSSDIFNTYGLLRSVIMNSQNKVLCFSPPKSISAELFFNLYPNKTDSIIAEEFVEGTMINVFFDKNIGVNGSWQIATRNTVGADVSYYKNINSKTFETMFFEACHESNVFIQLLNPFFCYSFVLQHPNNRIVVPFKSPQLYLVDIYFIEQDESSVKVIPQDIDEVKLHDCWQTTKIKFPERYSFNTYSELIEKFASANTPYNIMGVVIKTNNIRCKIRNPIYEEVRHLKGNQPKLQYQYLTLRKLGKIPDFLKHYPETKNDLSLYRDQIHMFTNTLHKNYISCYVKKEKPLKEFSDQYRTHMFKIHQQYINDLKPQGLYVSNTVVIKYVNDLHPSLLMYCLNYNMRKRMIDKINIQ
jgi:hypothetical protein